MTTTAKAKELRKVADQMITHAKIGDNDDDDDGCCFVRDSVIM